MEHLKNSDFDKTNIILVLDRAYHSHQLMNYLNDNNIKFVIRIRNNFKNINKFRVINYNYNIESFKSLKNNKTNQLEKYKVIENVELNIITNLEHNYDNTKIKEIYNSRWKVEEFFKLIKNNFKFENLREHNKETQIAYQKTYYIIQIICIIERIIENIFNKHIIDNKNNNKYNIKINKSNLIEGIYNSLYDIIFSKLTYEKIYNIGDIYIQYNYNEKNLNKPRISKTPFTKWYVKSYHSKYDIQNIFNTINEK